jgi:hypothetical protein
VDKVEPVNHFFRERPAQQDAHEVVQVALAEVGGFKKPGNGQIFSDKGPQAGREFLGGFHNHGRCGEIFGLNHAYDHPGSAEQEHGNDKKPFSFKDDDQQIEQADFFRLIHGIFPGLRYEISTIWQIMYSFDAPAAPGRATPGVCLPEVKNSSRTSFTKRIFSLKASRYGRS